MESLIYCLVGIAFGALASWYFTRSYYLRAKADADAASAEGLTQARHIQNALETLGAKFVWDSDGKVIAVSATKGLPTSLTVVGGTPPPPNPIKELQTSVEQLTETLQAMQSKPKPWWERLMHWRRPTKQSSLAVKGE
ncbi:MAG: hypothetical protein ABFE08_03085 [Armatimonadia bacterium]